VTIQPKFNKVRNARRAAYDTEAIHAILDAGLVGHVGFVAEGRPMVIPMAYARGETCLYLHGASKTRIVTLGAGATLCLTVTLIDGIVVARSGFHHSVNYRSAVVHGHGRLVTDEAERDEALDAITEHLLPGRLAEIRPMNAQERKATGVLALEVEAASTKVRTGPPIEDEAHRALGLWGGVLPVVTALGRGVPDDATPPGLPEPASLAAARRRFAG
jgi:uncharacterized protein